LLDPATAVATATAAYNVIKRGISFGQDLDSMASSLSKWYGAVSDFNYAEQEVNNTGGVTKLLMKGSIEKMALDITINKQKIKEQEKELRTLIMYTYGSNVYEEMIALRRKLRKQRENEVYRKRELKRQIVEFFLIMVLMTIIAAMVLGITWFIFKS